MNYAPSSREKILKAARSLFARYGYRGTSIRAIVAEAGVNLGAVTYHFGGKSGLYDAVIDSLLGPLEERIRAAMNDPGAPLDRIDRVIGIILDHLARNPEQAHIVLHELALQRPLPERAQRWIGFLFATLAQLIADGQADGTIIAGPPAMLAGSVVAQPFFFAITGPRVAEAAGLPIAQRDNQPTVVTGHLRPVIHRLLAVPRRES